MIKKQIFNKLYLNCRRGILELDIILINFLENKCFNLNNKDFINFISLLRESDVNLYSWLVKGEVCKEKKFFKIIFYIRKNTSKFDFD